MSSRRPIRLKGYDYSQPGLYFVTICCHNNICRFGKIENNEMNLNEFGQIASNEWKKLPERYPNMVLDVFQIMPNHIHGIISLCNMPKEDVVGATLAVAQNTTLETFVGATLAVDQNNNVDAQNKNEDTETFVGATLAVDQNNNVSSLNHKAGASPAPTNTVMIGNLAGASPANTTKHTIPTIVGAYKSLVTNKCLEIFKSQGKYMGQFLQRNYHEHIIRNETSYHYIANYIINNPINWKNDRFFHQ